MPFSTAEFLDVFREYNDAIYPMQAALVLLAIFAAIAPLRRKAVTAPIVAVLWVWCGIEYHWLHFAKLTPAAWVFGALFIVEAAIIIRERDLFDFEGAPMLRSVTGGVLINYALLLYPLAGTLSGHSYPQAPTFGAPCPLTIFTFGLLLMSARPLKLVPAIIPLVWSIFGLSAAWNFGMIEDAALPVAAMIYVTFLITGQPLRSVRSIRHRAA